MDNREEDQELQEEEEGGSSSSSKGSQEDPHPKTSPLSSPKVAKMVDPPLPPLSPRPSEESEFKRYRREMFKLYDLDHLVSSSEETDNNETPADSDENQENVKQFESSDKESVGTKSSVGSRNSPDTCALKTGSTNSDESLAESKTNEGKDKWGLSDVERVELESPVVSGNAPVASALKTESTDNFQESPADSSGNEALSSDNQEKEHKLEDEEEGIDEGPHRKTPSLSPSHHTPIHEKLSFSKESEDKQQELQLEPSEETVESKPPVGPRNPPVVTSALKTGSTTNSGKSLADSDTNKKVELKSPADSPQVKRIRTERSNPDYKSS